MLSKSSEGLALSRDCYNPLKSHAHSMLNVFGKFFVNSMHMSLSCTHCVWQEDMGTCKGYVGLCLRYGGLFNICPFPSYSPSSPRYSIGRAHSLNNSALFGVPLTLGPGPNCPCYRTPTPTPHWLYGGMAPALNYAEWPFLVIMATMYKKL